MVIKKNRNISSDAGFRFHIMKREELTINVCLRGTGTMKYIPVQKKKRTV